MFLEQIKKSCSLFGFLGLLGFFAVHFTAAPTLIVLLLLDTSSETSQHSQQKLTEDDLPSPSRGWANEHASGQNEPFSRTGAAEAHWQLSVRSCTVWTFISYVFFDTAVYSLRGDLMWHRQGHWMHAPLPQDKSFCLTDDSGRGMFQGTSWAAAPAAPAAVSCWNLSPAGERCWRKQHRRVVQSLMLDLLFPVQVCHKPSKLSAFKLDLERQDVALGFELHSVLHVHVPSCYSTVLLLCWTFLGNQEFPTTAVAELPSYNVPRFYPLPNLSLKQNQGKRSLLACCS